MLPIPNTYFMQNNIKIIDIVCGSYHTLCLDENGICWSFGGNWYGQCGVGKPNSMILSPEPIDLSTMYKIIKMKTGGEHSYICSEDGKHFLFGWNGYNQCGLSQGCDKFKIMSPFMINDKFQSFCIYYGFSKNQKMIKDVYLGLDNTWIVSIDSRPLFDSQLQGPNHVGPLL